MEYLSNCNGGCLINSEDLIKYLNPLENNYNDVNDHVNYNINAQNLIWKTKLLFWSLFEKCKLLENLLKSPHLKTFSYSNLQIHEKFEKYFDLF